MSIDYVQSFIYYSYMQLQSTHPELNTVKQCVVCKKVIQRSRRAWMLQTLGKDAVTCSTLCTKENLDRVDAKTQQYI